MDCYVTLVLLIFGCGLSSCSHFPLRTYYYINMPMNWTDAQNYCRTKYTDLATIESMDDIRLLNSPFSYSWAWIGLRDDPESWKGTMGNDANSWRWSATGETSKTGFHYWDPGSPDFYDAKETYAIMMANGQWNDFSYQSLSSFVCYTVTNQNETIYEFISTSKTWPSAQEYCREHHTDLPMIESITENNAVFSVKPDSATVWIGLYRVPWAWSDMSHSSFTNWRSTSPDNYLGNQQCVAENPQHGWNDIPCSNKLPFICHRVSKLKTTVRLKIKTNADLTDPAVNAQILQQLQAVLTRQKWTNFKLQWKIVPRKLEKNSQKEPGCDL